MYFKPGSFRGRLETVAAIVLLLACWTGAVISLRGVDARETSGRPAAASNTARERPHPTPVRDD